MSRPRTWTSDSIEWEISKYQAQIESTRDYLNRHPTSRRAYLLKNQHLVQITLQKSKVTELIAQLQRHPGNFTQLQIQRWAKTIQKLNGELRLLQQLIDTLAFWQE